MGNVKRQFLPSDDEIATTLVSNSPLVNYMLIILYFDRTEVGLALQLTFPFLKKCPVSFLEVLRPILLVLVRCRVMKWER